MQRPAKPERHEKIPVQVVSDPLAACRAVAEEIADLIRTRTASCEKAVLGLATGSAPVPLYRELIRRHREKGLSFSNVITFNLDEYYGLGPDQPESFFQFMRKHLFQHVDIRPENIHIPDGKTPREKIPAACRAYEEAIEAAGGIDIQILGLGRNGHIGFNEPGSAEDSLTRLITLDSLTRRDAAGNFDGEVNVPRLAITMGVSTILKARKIILLAWGARKAEIVARAVEGQPSEAVTASFLQRHPNTVVYVDPAAASELTRSKRS